MDWVFTAHSAFAYLPYGVLVHEKSALKHCIFNPSYMKQNTEENPLKQLSFFFKDLLNTESFKDGFITNESTQHHKVEK